MDGNLVQAVDMLADSLKHSPVWEAWEAARAVVAEDRDLAGLRARLQELTGRWQVSRATGHGFAGADANELATLKDRLKRHPLLLRQDEAGQQLVGLLQETNDLMTSMLGVDFAMNAARRTGGGCCG